MLNPTNIVSGIVPLPIKLWWQWMKNIPFSLKWFVWIMLFKPIIDAFYFVKDSGAFSPAQVLGFLSFILCLIYIISNRKKTNFTLADFFMLGFGLLLFLNAVLVYLIPFNISGLGDFVRIMFPIVLYFYLKKEIRSLDDLNGLLFAFLISSIFPYLIYLYEFFFSPIQTIELSEGRGGGIRLTGIYADMFNYMSYIIGDFFVLILYFTNLTFIKRKPSYLQLALVTILSIIGLIGIKHQASWGVFLCLLLLLILFNLGSKYGKNMIVIFGIGAALSFPYIWKQAIEPLYAKEINVYEGKSEQDRALNGRIIRWKKYFTIWENMSVESQLFGVGFSNHRSRSIMMSGGMHSDYVRFLFSTGIIGLLSYILIFFSIIYRSFSYPSPIRLFLVASVLILMLYAISSNPFGYSGSLLYICLIGLSLNTKPKSFFVDKPVWKEE